MSCLLGKSVSAAVDATGLSLNKRLAVRLISSSPILPGFAGGSPAHENAAAEAAARWLS